MAKTVRELHAQQAATAGILRAMARARGDPQPVFDAIVRSSVRLCKGAFGALFTYDGKMIGLGAQVQPNRKVREMFRRAFPQPITPTTPSAIAILERRVVNERDMLKAGYAADVAARARAGGYRSVLTVPMMRGRTPIGAIAVTRPQALPFDESHVTLLKTFATQAVMAIENARLFNDTKESLERETATAEILRVIAASPGDSQPVFDAIAKAAKELFGARYAVLARRVGDELHLAAHTMAGKREDASLRRFFPARITGQGALGKAVLTRKPAVIEDVETDPAYSEDFRKGARERGFRSLLAVPMVRDGVSIGAITVSRREAGSFSEHQIDLLKTFAEQAGIAIENARLFNETKEALERQTASAGILRVIAGAPTDVQPVFDAIAKAAHRLVAGNRAGILLRRGSHFEVVASSQEGVIENLPDEVRRVPLDRNRNFPSRVILDGETVHVQDWESADVPEFEKLVAKSYRIRSGIIVPLLRKGESIGALAVTRVTVGAFQEKEIALLRSFADQAVIAIENARLFNETKEALERQTATGDILSSISSSMDDAQPVFEAIVRNLRRLFGTTFAAVFLARDGKVHVGALDGEKAFVAATQEAYPLPLDDEEMLAVRVIRRREVLRICPIVGNPEAPAKTEQLAKASGYDSIIVAPMMCEGVAIGGIATARTGAIPFDDREVALIKSFADQAVIAIENARLFNETKEALERQTATSDILRVISATPTDTRPVFDQIVENARRLMAAKNAVILLRRGAQVVLVGYSAARPSATIDQLPLEVRVVPLDRDMNFPSRAILDREVINVPDWEADDVIEFERTVAQAYGIGSGVMVPLLRKGEGIGALAVTRARKGAFLDKEIALLRSFADQAVIAIENARLFNETKEALERQTATADILKVISGSPGDVRPVFEAIVSNAIRLVGGFSAVVTRLDADRVHLEAFTSVNPAGDDLLSSMFPIRLEDAPYIRRAVETMRPAYVEDLRTDEQTRPRARELAKLRGYRSILHVPMVRDDIVVGLIHVTRMEAGSFSEHHVDLLRTFADQAVIAIQNARLFNETKEALEQQTAGAHILRVISASPGDLAPVFQTILENALRLCQADYGAVFTFDGTAFDAVASAYARGGDSRLRSRILPGRETPLRLAGLELRTVHTADLLNDPRFSPPEEYHAEGMRAALAVPLLKDGRLVGALAFHRLEPGAFTDQQIALVSTFAAQAVIAIQNARLFNETKEALERQTATGEILKVISSSPTDTKPVFDAIASNAARLCEADNLGVFRVEGNELRMVGYSGTAPHARDVGDKFALTRGSLAGRAILEKRTIHIRDLAAEPDEEWQQAKVAQKVIGHRTALAVPLMRDGVALGAIFTRRMEVRPFSDKHIELLRSFADQAVIAIENARLFNETKEALERQTATAEILKVISSSPTDVQPVFDAVAQRAAQLCNAAQASVFMAEGDVLRRVAAVGQPSPVKELPIVRGLIYGRAFLECRAVHVEDLLTVLDEYPDARENQRSTGFRTLLAVPMLREGKAIGTIGAWHREVKPFSREQIELLETFAAQAVIAIENVRLLNETKESLEQQTAISEILRVISASPSDVKPVLDAVALRAARICDASDSRIFLVDGDTLRHTAGFGDVPMATALGDVIPLSRGWVVGRAIIDRTTIHIEDMQVQSEDEYPLGRAAAERGGWRTVLAVPLMREQRPLGGIILRRKEVRPFSEKQVALLKTFAEQAAIAIENVRLFNATQEALEQQTATTEVLNVISSSITDARPVFDAIARSVLKLYGARNVGLAVRAGETIDRVGYAVSDSSADDGTQALYPIPLDERSLSGRAILRGEVIHIRDVETEEGLSEHSRAITRKTGARSVLIAPMYSMGTATGALAIARRSPGGFSEREVDMIRTFADQAVIAMENVRLFREIEEKSAQLKEASEHKSQFLASMSHELRTPLNALLGFNEMILGDIYGEVPGDMRPPLLQMQASGKHLLRLINNVLDLAKIEAGRMELALADYSVHEVVESVRATLRPLAQEKGLDLVAELAADLPLARGDAGRITQCLMNLAGNSLKFTKAGKVQISVAADNGLLRYRVADTGIGIAPDKINGLFTEFKQTDATVASEYGGTGLGLAISKKFVEMHGGRIWVESEPGRGSVFTFEVPLRAAAQ